MPSLIWLFMVFRQRGDFFKLGGASFSKPHSPKPPQGCRPLCHGFVRFFVFSLKNLLAFFLSVTVHVNEGRELVQERMSSGASCCALLYSDGLELLAVLDGMTPAQGLS